eukprot:GEMP01131914.1.p1 GENE.GEMP01131914.1~~GEMP01131914.1.p1  ORF type:complete len:115 (+),score=22.55 GEMP01131914.1:131-475(+)
MRMIRHALGGILCAYAWHPPAAMEEAMKAARLSGVAHYNMPAPHSANWSPYCTNRTSHHRYCEQYSFGGGLCIYQIRPEYKKMDERQRASRFVLLKSSCQVYYETKNDQTAVRK